ncbi:hypothetical protein NFI96_007183 [Prochilodus magdalenae]|nr:hypothetical protein NFI96_007183 [Prochilodus magdalenae]
MNTAEALRSALACLALLPRFVFAALALWLLDFLCVRKRVMVRARARDEEEEVDGEAEEEEGRNADDDDPPLCVSDSDRMFSVASLRAVWHGHKLDALKVARVGRTAPNSEVVRLADARRRRILEYARGARPLVLNFGSCT